MSAEMSRTTPSGYGSFAVQWDIDGKPSGSMWQGVRLIEWKEHTGTIAVHVPLDEVPAYAAALLAEYVKAKKEQEKFVESTR